MYVELLYYNYVRSQPCSGNKSIRRGGAGEQYTRFRSKKHNKKQAAREQRTKKFSGYELQYDTNRR